MTDVLARLTRRGDQLPLVLGHRGARHAAPENTHAAFDLSRVEGAAGVELDVRIVKTGEIVVLHDPTLARVTGGADRRAVEDLPLAEALKADIGQGERVPLLTDVLRKLVQEEVSVRNIRAILEALVAPTTEGDAAALAERCRQALHRYLSHKYAPNGPLYAYLADPEVEQTIRDADAGIDPDRVQIAGLAEPDGTAKAGHQGQIIRIAETVQPAE